MNILIRDSARLVTDIIHPSGEISLSHLDTYDGFYQYIVEYQVCHMEVEEVSNTENVIKL